MTTPLTHRTFAAVLFDNDGTLIDSAPAVVRAWTTWAAEHGVDILTLRGFHGVPAAGIIQAVAPHLDQQAALARIIELEESDTTDVLALPGAVEALTALGPRAAIATSATRGLALARLHAAGIPLPEVIVTVEDITHGKPHPEPYLLAAERVGADPADCLVVEDAPSGLTSARAAGCATVAVVTTGERHELEADLVVPDLSHVRFGTTSGRVALSLA
ncbi:HAD-IA family hydrolase [Ornithinimicrobium sediminis]|uniref:HAD-IA family hydrolase n=1 Tax=Ornithinimicrobium sediminis TaxID=2904603 RepID=UPI001E38413E|nr:HAD-IA family hydrolase [Ornithinimicrobium sediminis]MCE0486519.1 HAD-IA family hydrolase [Ornithinimicrobium sediminis]